MCRLTCESGLEGENILKAVAGTDVPGQLVHVKSKRKERSDEARRSGDRNEVSGEEQVSVGDKYGAP